MKRLTSQIGFAALSLCGGAILLWQGAEMPIIFLVGVLFLPIVTFSAMRHMSRAVRVVMMAACLMICMVGAPTYGLGATLFMLWYGVAVVHTVLTELTIHLYHFLLYGGTVYGALTCASVCWAIRDHYGVWDIRAIFRFLETVLFQSIDKMKEIYATLMPQGEQLNQLYEQFDQFAAQSEAFAYQWICLGLTLLAAHYFLNLKLAEQVWDSVEQPLTLTPLYCLDIPKRLAMVYMLLTLFGQFFVGMEYRYAMDIALSLTGYIFVLAGIGLIDGFSMRLPHPLRMFIKFLLVLFAIVSDNFLLGIGYTILCVMGIFRSFYPLQLVLRARGEYDE